MHLLTTQLESQRKYWEEQVAKAEERARGEKDQVVKNMKQIEENAADMQTKVWWVFRCCCLIVFVCNPILRWS